MTTCFPLLMKRGEREEEREKESEREREREKERERESGDRLKGHAIRLLSTISPTYEWPF